MGKAKRRRAALKSVSLETCAIGKGGEFKRVQKRCAKVMEGQSAQSGLALDAALAAAATQQDPLELQQMSAMQGGGGESGGMSTTTIIALAGGGIVLVGLAAYLILAD